MKRSFGAVLLVFSITMATYLLVLLSRAIYVDGYMGRQLEREFDYTLDSPMIRIGPAKSAREVAQLTHVSLSGQLGQSGFRTGDILLDMHQHEFHLLVDRAFHNNGRKNVEVLRRVENDGRYVRVDVELRRLD
ncbi:MAG: hypothetical protein WDZ59_02330 [Pirellulales bacterium]